MFECTGASPCCLVVDVSLSNCPIGRDFTKFLDPDGSKTRLKLLVVVGRPQRGAKIVFQAVSGRSFEIVSRDSNG